MIQIDTPLGPNELLVAGFSGTETLSELFEFRLELISENPAIDANSLLGKNVTVRIRHKDGQAERYFNGYVNRFLRRSDYLEGYAVYEATLVPCPATTPISNSPSSVLPGVNSCLTIL